ncbi:hypothetical protein [Streptomyces sp. NPDC020742]|uniref:hypothetical protein n=1 Tax=unclassified Streptomyces TaxID=2593676 RepID=UPI0033FA7B58
MPASTPAPASTPLHDLNEENGPEDRPGDHGQAGGDPDGRDLTDAAADPDRADRAADPGHADRAADTGPTAATGRADGTDGTDGPPETA